MFNDWNGPDFGCHLASRECRGELHECKLGWHRVCEAHSKIPNGECVCDECLEQLKALEAERQWALCQDSPSDYERAFSRRWFHLDEARRCTACGTPITGSCHLCICDTIALHLDEPALSPIAAFIYEQLAMEACFV